jgi:hypothetical protein
MLTRLIVASYTWLIEAGLWLAIAAASIAGYQITVPAMVALGAMPMPEFAWQILGAVVLPVVTLLVLAAIAGPLLILLDIRQSLRSLEARLTREEPVRRSVPAERKEPSI